MCALCGVTVVFHFVFLIRWETLWSGLPQQKEVQDQYRTFSPHLKSIDYPTKLVTMICTHVAMQNASKCSMQNVYYKIYV